MRRSSGTCNSSESLWHILWRTVSRNALQLFGFAVIISVVHNAIGCLPAKEQDIPTTIHTYSGNRIGTRRTKEDLEFCRNNVFVTQYDGVPQEKLDRTCTDPLFYNVCQDLADFTGLLTEEVATRMARLKQFNFEEEHLFWNPQTASELAWYYASSQGYLFANAIHPPKNDMLDLLQKGVHEPVLEYAGGVGNNMLYLVIERGFEKYQYLGIGLAEKAFAQYRVAKKGLQNKVAFLHPYSEITSWKFDPINSLPRDASLGAILAFDVLEHIPEYQHTVKAMVDSLKVGGVIMENTPFAKHAITGAEVDTRIHVHNGGITRAQAMGSRMVFESEGGYWKKIKA